MPRHDRPHPLGKVTRGKRLDLSLPGAMFEKLQAIATLHGQPATTWARDLIEKAIEGEWAFMQRRIAGNDPDNARRIPGESPD